MTALANLSATVIAALNSSSPCVDFLVGGRPRIKFNVSVWKGTDIIEIGSVSP